MKASISVQYDESGKRFRDLQKEGVDSYGVLWLKAQEVAIDAALSNNVDVWTPAAKEILSVITLSVLKQMSMMEVDFGRFQAA